MRTEIQNGIMKTLQDFNMNTMNKENIDHNVNTPQRINYGFAYSSGYNYPVDQRYSQPVICIVPIKYRMRHRLQN